MKTLILKRLPVLFFALLLSAWGVALAQPQPPPQTPQVQPKQQPESATRREPQNTEKTKNTKNGTTGGQQMQPEDPNRKTEADANKRAEEASEYWPWPILGRRLKITDTLLALFTFLLVLVGIGQGIFFYRTDQSTHKVAEAANKSADAAQKSVDALVSQLRASIGIISGSMKVVDFKEGGKGVAIHIELRNSGQTTGYEFTTWIKQPKILEPEAVPFDEATPLNQRTGKSVILAGANASIDWIVAITEDELQAVRLGSKNIFVWGGADFITFKEPHYFIFRIVNGPDIGNAFALKPHKLGYDAN